MNLLRQSFAPISESGWDEINGLAKETLTANLSARRFCDVEGPFGINYTGVNLGRLEVPQGQKKDAVQYGINRVLPLVEARVSFSVNIWELDNVERGAKDIELDAVVEAAKKMAAFEESAVYNGLPEAGIEGLNGSADASRTVEMSLEKDSVIDSISEGLRIMRSSGIDSEANLIVNPELWKFQARMFPGGNLGASIKKQIGGSIIYSDTVKGALLVSNRDGDFELTIGQDFSVGYHSHDSEKVNLFLSESFTFRIITPEALVAFKIK